MDVRTEGEQTRPLRCSPSTLILCVVLALCTFCAAHVEPANAHTCDGLNQRIVKSIYSGGSLDHRRHVYYSEAWQELEVRKEVSGTEDPDPLEQYVWHAYFVDAPLLRDYDPETDGTSTRYYYTHDANFNVTSVVGNNGAVLERYDYTSYGQLAVLDADFAADADGASDFDNPVTFTGRRFDSESGLYHFRNRDYHAQFGAFTSRDPYGYVDSPNLAAADFVPGFVDPFGLGKSWAQRVRANRGLQNDLLDEMHIPRKNWGEAGRKFDRGIAVLDAGVTFVGTLPKSAAQGTLNTVNGLQDIGVGLANQVKNCPAVGAGLGNLVPDIPSSDWAKDAVMPEDQAWHDWSKFLGSNGLLGLITLGMSELAAAEAELGTPAATLPNTTRGWRVGDPINNLTREGNVPSWDAVRARYWKNEGLNNAGNFTAENLARMRRGLAPQQINPITGFPESMELHHWPPQRIGGLFDFDPVWPSEHQRIDPFRHTGG